MGNFKSLATLSSSFLLFLTLGCAGMQQAYQDQICTDSGGYERGMNDSRAEKPMDQSFAQACDASRRDTALLGYRRGYGEGLASLQAGKPATLINVNLGTGTDGSQKKYYCEVKAFTKTFSAWGSSELEARVGAKKSCTQEYNEMHCEEAECKSTIR
jgi:hypothetical protein